MRMNAPIKTPRRSTNISLATELVDQAKALDINLSRACEAGLESALKEERKRRWLEENTPAIEAWNTWMEENELPLAKYRMF